MLSNTQIAEHLIRGKLVGSDVYAVGTGVKVRHTHAYLYDETIAAPNERWVKITPLSIEKCIGITDSIGTPIFDNDVLLDTRSGVKTVVKYDRYEHKWTMTHYVKGVEFVGDASYLASMADKLVVVEHYEQGFLVKGVSYTKPLNLEAYNDEQA